jgi:hypothetical protein
MLIDGEQITYLQTFNTISRKSFNISFDSVSIPRDGVLQGRCMQRLYGSNAAKSRVRVAQSRVCVAWCEERFFNRKGRKAFSQRAQRESCRRYKLCTLCGSPAPFAFKPAFDTRSPYTFRFEENQRGQTVFFCLRWENTTGQKGPWSEIVSAIIP